MDGQMTISNRRLFPDFQKKSGLGLHSLSNMSHKESIRDIIDPKQK
jgi:hypothetical protein